MIYQSMNVRARSAFEFEVHFPPIFDAFLGFLASGENRKSDGLLE
jgi:hypothetical protein